MLGHFLMGQLSTLDEVASSGRSGSFFFKSEDGRYLVKTLPFEEYDFFKRNLIQFYRVILLIIPVNSHFFDSTLNNIQTP